MPKAINTFTDKIVSDLDHSVITPQQWVFPTVNVRVFNKDGKGFIASTLPGNELIFSLADGFVIVGAEEYNGVLYIASHNTTTGAGELGTYPGCTGSSFTPTYLPLNNLGDVNTPLPMTTTRFNFNLSFPVSILIKGSYDDSVDLYLSDFNNPNRVINSGFNQLGVANERFYLESYFDGAINQIAFTIKDIYIDPADDVVATGGYLKPGNYFLYLRYLTTDYAHTSYVKEVGPISIIQGDTAKTAVGMQEKEWVKDTINRTDKKITLVLSNLDTNFSYLEIAVARYTALQENALYSKDTYLIDKYYDLASAVAGEISIEIYGNESEKLSTYDEMIREPNEYNICKAQAQISDRWLGVNWKRGSLTYDREALKTFAQKIVIGSFHNDTIMTDTWPTAEDYANNLAPLPFYADGNNIIKYVGYFKNQIYPFAIQYEFDNGSLSEWFPCKGTGDSDQDGYKGLFKFPSWSDAATEFSGIVSQKYLTGVQFDLGLVEDINSALYYYANLPDGKFNSIVGFRFGRGDRIENLLYQGVMLRGFNGIYLEVPGYSALQMTFQTPQDGSEEPITGNDPSTASIIPLFRGNLPLYRAEEVSLLLHYYGSSCEDNADCLPCLGNYPGYTIPSHDSFFTQLDNDYDHHHGLFSPDLLFELNPTDSDPGYIEPLFYFENETTNVLNILTKDEDIYYYPREYVLDLNQDIAGISLKCHSENEHEVASSFVEVGQSNGKYHFNSYLPGAGASVGFTYRNFLFNRNIYCSRYMGIVDTTPTRLLKDLYGTFNPNKEYISIVNFYRNSNDTTFFSNTRSSFNVATSYYAAISEMTPKANLVIPQLLYQMFKGDCFLQKTWFRQSRWRTMEYHGNSHFGENIKDGFGGNMLDECGNWYQHGLLIGLVTENKYNSSVRNDVTAKDDVSTFVEYSSFPKVLSEDITVNQWARNEGEQYLFEAQQINDGYNHLLSDRKGLGFDVTEPVHEDQKPNRVYVSDAAIAGSFFDGYRQIGIGAFKDYGIDSGPIMDIRAILDYPVLIHERGINQLYLNEQAKGRSESGEFILGSSATFLGDRVRKLAIYGSQHRSSIVEGVRGIYGFDFHKRIAWRINRQEGKGGGFYLNSEEVSTDKLVQSWIKELLDQYSTENDILNQLPDTPLLGLGIVSGADSEFKEILFSFLLEKNGVRIDRTLVYDESLDGFRGEYSFAEPFYCNLGTMLLSVQHEIVNGAYKLTRDIFRYNRILTSAFNDYCFDTGTQLTILMPVGSVVYEHPTEQDLFILVSSTGSIISSSVTNTRFGPWTHRVGIVYTSRTTAGGVDNYNTFFGVPATMKLSFIVNGMSQDPQSNTSKLDKIFESLMIECRNYNLYRILFETQYQSGTWTFQSAGADFWLDAEYLEHKWHVPIVMQDSGTEEQFDVGSEFKGMWMKVTIEYQGNKDLEIKSVETNYNILTS